MESLEQRLVLAAPSLMFIEPDGDLVTIHLTGPGQVASSDPDGNGIRQLDLVGTDTGSTLQIAVKKGRTGNGFAALDALNATSVNRITARAVDLVGSGLHLTGALGTAQLHDLLNGADVVAAGQSTQRTSISAHVIGDGSTVDLGSAISNLTVAAFGDGAVRAPSLASLSTVGDKKVRIAGDWRADIDLSGAGLPTGQLTLGTATIAGELRDATVNVAGGVGSVSVARMVNSNIFAGFSPNDLARPLAGGTFLPGQVINSFKATGIKRSSLAAFDSSTIAADRLGKITLASIATQGTHQPYGVIARHSIGAVKATGSGFQFDTARATPQGIGDFQVLIAVSAPSIAAIATDSGVAGDGVTNDNAPTVNGTADPISNVTVLLDGNTLGTAAANATGNWSFNVPAQSDGTYRITAIAQDSFGNRSAASAALVMTIDTTGPSVTVSSPAPGAVTDRNVAITGQVTLDGAGLPALTAQTDSEPIASVPIDAAGNFSITTNLPLDGSADGNHRVLLQATDVAGNTSSVEVTFMLDTHASNQSIILTEGGDLVVEQSVPVELGQQAGKRFIHFEIDAQFDRSDRVPAVEDMFLVYLVDPADSSRTLLDRGKPGTALFALAGDASEFQPGQVRYDGSSVEIDASPLAHLTSGRLLFQLINSDGDTGSSITIRNLTSFVGSDGSTGPAFPVRESDAPAGSGLDLSGFTASSDVALLVSNVRVDAPHGRYTANLQLRNLGPATGRQVAVAFASLPNGVQLANPSGHDAEGNPYINFQNAIPPGGLGTDAVSSAIEVSFDDPNLIRFSLVPTVRVGPSNRAPTFDPIAVQTVVPGDRLELSLDAIDPDGDPVTFALRSDQSMSRLPVVLRVSQAAHNPGLAARFTLAITPTPADVGTYNFDLIASDGALETTQTVRLQVESDPVTTTRISGIVRDTGGQPMVNVPVEIGPVQVMTLADGSFTLELLGQVPSSVLTVRGDLVSGGTVYSKVAADLPLLLGHEIFAGAKNVIGRPIELPSIDVGNAVTINPASDTSVATPAVPNSLLFVAAGTLEDELSNPYNGQLGITEIPAADYPVNLPDGLSPDVVVILNPSGLVFSTPAPLTLPNRAGWASGTLMDLWALDPATGLFADVGDGRVSTDGSRIATIAGGVRATSLLFFVPQPETPLDLVSNVLNETAAGNEQVQTAPLTSQVELGSGALVETHELVTYQSLGEARGVSLRYDSLRADPRPIVHFGYPNIDPVALAGDRAADLRMAAQLTLRCGGLSLEGAENFWSVPAAGRIDAALQTDLTSQPSGLCSADVSLGLLLPSGQQFSGTATTHSSTIIHVNTISSPFGAGWGLAGLQELIENSDGSVLLLDGDGSELLFGAPPAPGASYQAPAGDFTVLQKVDDGTGSLVFQRTTTERTVYLFNATNQLTRITDRNGNTTQYVYDATNRLTAIVDPVGLETRFTYTGDRVSEITDPAQRVTRLQYDTSGNLTRVTDPDSSERNWQYDARHHMIVEIDKRGFREETSYGFHGRAIRGVLGDGSVRQVDPAETHGLYPPAETLDPATAPPAVALPDAAVPQADPNGNVTQTTLDQLGQITGQLDDIGCLVGGLQRNEQNLITVALTCNGNSLHFAFDLKGNPISVGDAISGIPPISYDVASAPRALALGDLNGDGAADIVTANAGSTQNPAGLTIWFGDGSGSFGGRMDVPVGSLNPTRVALARLDADSDLDIVLASVSRTGAGTISVLLNQGGTFPARSDIAVAPFVSDVVPGDFDGDGDIDLAVNYRRELQILMNSGNATFVPKPTFTMPGPCPNPWFLAGGDLDGDGRTDLVWPNTDLCDGAMAMVAFVSNGDGTFEAIHYADTRDPVYGAVGDINGDGFADVITMAGEQGGTLSAFLNSGTGFFGSAIASPINASVLDRPSLSDVNGDGHVDVVFVAYDVQLGRQVRSMLPGNGDGTFGTVISFPKYEALSSAVADLDNDSDVDIVTINDFPSPTVTVILNNAGQVPTGEGAGPRRFSFDPAYDQLLDRFDALGHETLYSIDPRNGDRLSQSQVIGHPDITSGESDDLVTRFSYTSNGLVDTETDPLGRIKDNDYDAFGRLIRITYAKGTADEGVRQFEYDLAGNQTAMIDENGHRTEWEFDAMNRLVRVTQADPDGLGPLLSPISRFGYDAAGNQLSITDARGNVTTNEYDALNRVIRTTAPDPDGSAEPAQSAPVTIRQYDSAGNMIAVIDPVGHETRNVYDTRNRLIQTIDTASGITAYKYDDMNNRTAIIDADGNRTEFVYDSRNRLVRESDPLGKSIAYEYDAADRRTAKIDRLGRRTEFTYDELNRLISEIWVRPGGNSSNPADVVNRIVFTYDSAGHGCSCSSASHDPLQPDNGPIGNRLTIRDNTSSLAYTYDNRNRVLTVDNSGTPGAPHVLLTYTYDPVGNIRTVSDTIEGQPAGSIVYSYNALDRMTRVTQSGNGVSDKRVDFAYNELGQFSTIARFADLLGTQLVVQSTYSYDGLNRLQHLAHNNGAGNVAFYDLTFDAAGRITEISDNDGSRTFEYDDTNQLTGVMHANSGITNESFSYDANGNRTGSGIVVGPGNRVLSNGGLDYQYDAEGNLVCRIDVAGTAVREFQYDYRNRLTAVLDRLVSGPVVDCTVPGTETQRVEFTYDALDRRIAERVQRAASINPPSLASDQIAYFVYDRDDVLLDFVDDDGPGPQRPALSVRYLHGPAVDQVLAQENLRESDPTARVLWLLGDQIGTTRDLVDNSGTVRNHITYDSFGRVLSETDSRFTTRYLFTGREFNSTTKLYYYRARYYDPRTGRFLAEDPIRFEAGDSNLVRYVRNNPVSRVDPSGRDSNSEQPDPDNSAVGQSLIDLLAIFRRDEDRCRNLELAREHYAEAHDWANYNWVDQMYQQQCSVEWLFLACLGVIAGGRVAHERRKRADADVPADSGANCDNSSDCPEGISRDDIVLEELI